MDSLYPKSAREAVGPLPRLDLPAADWAAIIAESERLAVQVRDEAPHIRIVLKVAQGAYFLRYQAMNDAGVTVPKGHKYGFALAKRKNQNPALVLFLGSSVTISNAIWCLENPQEVERELALIPGGNVIRLTVDALRMRIKRRLDKLSPKKDKPEKLTPTAVLQAKLDEALSAIARQKETIDTLVKQREALQAKNRTLSQKLDEAEWATKQAYDTAPAVAVEREREVIVEKPVIEPGPVIHDGPRHATDPNLKKIIDFRADSAINIAEAIYEGLLPCDGGNCVKLREVHKKLGGLISGRIKTVQPRVRRKPAARG